MKTENSLADRCFKEAVEYYLNSKSFLKQCPVKNDVYQIKFPVLDEKPFRVFHSMAEYRRWANDFLPEWLGYARKEDERKNC